MAGDTYIGDLSTPPGGLDGTEIIPHQKSPGTPNTTYGSTLSSIFALSQKTPLSVSAKTDSWTIETTDSGKLFVLDAATEKTITIPNNLPVGFNFSIVNVQGNKINLDPGSLDNFRGGSADAVISAGSPQTAYEYVWVCKITDTKWTYTSIKE